MRSIIIDIETNSTATHIWCAVTKDLSTKEVNVWDGTDKISRITWTERST